MPTITDPDNLFDTGNDSAGKNIHIDTALRTIKIRNNSAAPQGPVMDETGVTLQALYSFLKEEWKDDPNNKSLIAYPFPLIAITPEQFEWRYGWSPADDSSRTLIRTAGWREFGTDNSTQLREYMGTISLGNVDGDQNQDDAGDQDFVYYAFFDSANGVSSAGPFDYSFPGPVNQAVQTFGNADNGNIERRGDILRLFIRQPAKTFDQTDTVDIGITAGTTLPFNAQRFPLVEGADLKVIGTGSAAAPEYSDAVISAARTAGSKYTAPQTGSRPGSTITYLAADQSSGTFGYAEDLFGGSQNFGVKIFSENGATEAPLSVDELYAWTQFQLRQDSDIAFGDTVKKGKLADELLAFVGDTLTTKQVTNVEQNGAKTGTAITNILSDDINNVQLLPTGATATLKRFPFSTNIQVSFSQDILDDSEDAKVFLYYDHTRDYAVGAEIGTSITIADVGANGSQDSANFTLNGTVSFTPLNTTGVVAGGPKNPRGLNPSVDADAYFRTHLAAGTGANHNVIWKITRVVDSSNFAAITIDDTVAPEDGTLSTTNDAIYTHPINSPGAILLDSASVINQNAFSEAALSTLATANLDASNRFNVTYAFDNNDQKDRETSNPFTVNIRALGLNTGQWVETTSRITQVNTNAISVVSPVERNYSNPA